MLSFISRFLFLVASLHHSCRWVAYGNKLLHNKFDGTAGFSIDGGIKDSTHIRRLSTELNAPMPAIETAHHNLLTARALHTAQARTGTTSFPVLDWSALIAGTRVAAGLEPFDGPKARSRSLSRPLCDTR